MDPYAIQLAGIVNVRNLKHNVAGRYRDSKEVTYSVNPYRAAVDGDVVREQSNFASGCAVDDHRLPRQHADGVRLRLNNRELLAERSRCGDKECYEAICELTEFHFVLVK